MTAWQHGFRPVDPLEMVAPGMSPGGLYVQVVCDGEVVDRHVLNPSDMDRVEQIAEADAELTHRLGGQDRRVLIYDGDTGTCVMTLVSGPQR